MNKPGCFLANQIKLRGHKANIVDPLIAKLPLLNKRFVEYQKSKVPENIKKVQDAAMGYYISPIVSVALGYIIFKEKLSKIQFLSLILILIAKINLIVNIGSIPWIAISLATTWSLYGVIRKKLGDI